MPKGRKEMIMERTFTEICKELGNTLNAVQRSLMSKMHEKLGTEILGNIESELIEIAGEPVVKDGYVIEKIFTYKGYKCVVALMHLGHRCGYVALPKDSEYYGEKYDYIDLDCHGGLTYSDFGYPLDDGNYYIGFDCAHYGDGKDLDALRKYFPNNKSIEMYAEMESMFGHDEEIRDIEYVKSELINLVDQLTEGE